MSLDMMDDEMPFSPNFDNVVEASELLFWISKNQKEKIESSRALGFRVASHLVQGYAKLLIANRKLRNMQGHAVVESETEQPFIALCPKCQCELENETRAGSYVSGCPMP